MNFIGVGPAPTLAETVTYITRRKKKRREKALDLIFSSPFCFL
jgi:hypothetical protein